MKAPTTTLAQRLVLARGDAGLQQGAVAKEVGISQPSYSDLETGKSKATTKIGSLARVLGVDAYWLETGHGAMRSARVAEEAASYIPQDRRALLAWYEGLTDQQRKAMTVLFGIE